MTNQSEELADEPDAAPNAYPYVNRVVISKDLRDRISDALRTTPSKDTGAVVAKLVKAADENPFLAVGHFVEHVAPESRALSTDRAPGDVEALVEGIRAASYWKSSDGYTEEFSNLPERAADTLQSQAATILSLQKQVEEREEALERCATIVERNLYRQNEKVEDVPIVARSFLAQQARP